MGPVMRLCALWCFLWPWMEPSATYSQESVPQGFSPFAIAVTNDGKYAYVCFDLSEVAFKIRLTDLFVEGVADLTDFFPLGSDHIALNASESKVFVYARAKRKLLVIDAQTMQLIHVIDNFNTIGFTQSKYGSSLISWDGGGLVKFVDTETYAVRDYPGGEMKFVEIEESSSSRDKWYVVSGNPREGYRAGVYDTTAKMWSLVAEVPIHSSQETFSKLKVMPNEQKVYVTTFGGWYPDFHAYGWLYSIDLAARTTKTIAIDGGSVCVESSPDGQRLYVGTLWPIPNTNNLLLFDAVSDSLIGSVNFGRNKYGWAYTQINDLEIDPTNPRWLYGTSTDANAFVKVDLVSRTLLSARVLNKEGLRPHFFARSAKQAVGNVLVHQSANAFQMDLDRGIINSVMRLPAIRTDAYAYDMASYGDGRLLVAQGESMLEVDAMDMRLIGNHWLPSGICLWHFTLSKDQKTIYTISPAEARAYSNSCLAVNTRNFQLEGFIKLEGGIFNYRPYELPDRAKLYALGGQQNGPVVVHVISTSTRSHLKTIVFDQPGLLGISATPYYPFAYDSASNTLFVGATEVVLGIDAETDSIKKVIRLRDAATAIGLEPWQLTYVNATGLVYSPKENLLYIAHLDRSFVSMYDLSNDRFMPKVIPLKGYFPNYIFSNDDCSKIYSLNIRSDNISVIDTYSKKVEKVIDLQSFINTGVQDGETISEEFSLSQNYPNPFNPSTAIQYSLATEGHVSLRLYDVLGRLMMVLKDGCEQAGKHTVTVDASRLSSGVYFYQLHAVDASAGSARSYVETKKMVLVR